jgi:hypothetical protein
MRCRNFVQRTAGEAAAERGVDRRDAEGHGPPFALAGKAFERADCLA